MWKPLRYVLYFIIFIIIFSVTYAFREYYYVPFIQQSISKVTDSKLKFRTFSLESPFNLVLYDVVYNDEVFVDIAKFGFEPFVFFKNLSTPLKSISAVKINKVTYIHKQKNHYVPTKKQQRAFQRIKFKILQLIFSLFNVNCNINKIQVLYNDKLINSKNINIDLNKEIDIYGNIIYSNQTIHTKGNIKYESDFITTDFYTEIEGSIKTKFDLLGTYNLLDNSFEYNINTKELIINRLYLGNIKTNIKKDSTTFIINSNGDNIKVFFKSKDFDFNNYFSTGTIKLRDVSDILNTKIDYTATKTKGLLNLTIDAKDTFIFGSKFGDFNLTANNQAGIYNIHGYHNSGNSFKTTISNKDSYYNLDIYNNNNKIGNIYGNYKKGEIAINLKNIPINKIPFTENFGNIVHGKLSMYGKIGTKSGTIYLIGNHFASKKIKGFDILGKVYKKNYIWFANINTTNKKIVMDAFYEDKKNNELNVYYNAVDAPSFLKVLGIKKPQLSGKITGKIKYTGNDFTTLIDMHLKQGTLFENKFNTFDICGQYSNNQIIISTFSFNGPQTKIKINSLIDFSSKNSNSYLNANINNFKVNGINLNCNLSIKEQLKANNEIIGNLSVSKLELGEIKLNYDSSLSLSKNKIKIYDLKNDNGLSGEITYDFTTKKIFSFIENVNSKLSKHNSKIKGRLNSKTTISGTIKEPEIVSVIKIKNGLYNSLLFNLDTKTEYKKGKVFLKNFKIITRDDTKSTLTGSGILDKEKTNIKIKFNNISEKTVNKYVGFITPFKGIFYGDGKVTGKLNNLKYILNLYADTIFVKSLKFNSFASKFMAQNKVISIENAKVKISDSELQILSANFDVKTLKYNSKFKFVNTHLGPFDIFGNINIDGAMIKQDKAYIYKGNIKFINLWLNEEKLNALILNYSVIDKKFKFKTDKESELKFSGNILLNKYPNIVFEKFLLEYDKQYCKFDGSIFSDKLDIKMTGKQLDLSVLTGLLNFPLDIKGALDFNLNGKGSISNPKINLSMNSSNGSMYNVLFDLCNIKIDINDNNVNIDKFSIKKSGKYNFIMDGFFPFWLDSNLKEKLMKEKLNINYMLEDNSLYILKNLSQNSITSKKGTFKIDGKLTGSRQNILSTGELSLEGTNIKTNSYISKMKDLKIDILWTDNLFTIKRAIAKVGSGILEATGSVKMQNFKPEFYNLNMFTNKKGIPLIFKELPIPTSGVFNIEVGNLVNFSKGVPIFNFKLYGNAKEPKLTGTAELENTTFCFPSPVNNSSSEIFDFFYDLFQNLYIDIDLKSATNTKYENSLVNAELKGDLNLKGTIDELCANGIMISNSGLFSYLGNDFTIINSKIEIINNEFFITAEGESEVYSTGDSTAEIIKVYVDRSNINNIKLRFASKTDPTLDSQKALARLTKTDPSKTSTLDTSTDFLVKQQAIRMFSSNIATPLANSFLKKTGLFDNFRLGFVNQDTLQISSKEEASMAELLYGMKYSVEKNLNKLLQVGYSVTFDKIRKTIDLKQAVELSFKLNRNLFLKGSYGLKADNQDYEPDKRLVLEQKIRF